MQTCLKLQTALFQAFFLLLDLYDVIKTVYGVNVFECPH